MRKNTRVLLAVAIVAVLMVGLVAQVQAKVTRIEGEVYEYVCANDMETMWQEGDVLHIRNYHHTNIDVSDTPELNGINTTVADAEINLKNGNTSIRGTMSIKPDTINGTWEGTWTFIANNGVTRGYAVGHGTGELSGKQIYLYLYDAEYDPEGTATACEGIGEPESNGYIVAYILDTN